ncbi:hypothetical protein Y032_0022g581 [Ancylostoma ceylanicum]|uniref:Uncharacterized protein n=1 Tax=Ancylostoma ceylanicum TaxID=53326 RepID=A0A016UYS3_9BILA|nr:hypothetical protein Y032_0022g581 [Ancylostoma ceylanicum]
MMSGAVASRAFQCRGKAIAIDADFVSPCSNYIDLSCLQAVPCFSRLRGLLQIVFKMSPVVLGSITAKAVLVPSDSWHPLAGMCFFYPIMPKLPCDKSHPTNAVGL